MSHATAWRCRSCGSLLGRVHNGILFPHVPVASVDGQGAVRIPCPTCGRVRTWSPSGSTAMGRRG